MDGPAEQHMDEVDQRLKRHAYDLGQQLAQFSLDLVEEGDRSAVILGAARLDVALERLLKYAMVPNAGGSDKLFDTDRPVSAFSAKITLAYRLGLIDGDVEHALQMIRKIRNDFAHSIDRAALSDSPHIDRVDVLTKRTQKNSLWGRFRPFFDEALESQPSCDFGAALTVLLWVVEFAATVHQEIDTTVVVKHTAKLDETNPRSR